MVLERLAHRPRAVARLWRGTKELVLAKALPDRQLVAFEIATQALALAARMRRAPDRATSSFQAGDFNDLQLERDSFDAVVGLGVFHHIENLEGFWSECRRALRKGGVILGQEYVGPDRFQWTEAQLEHGNRVLRDLVPARHKVHHDRVERLTIEHMVSIDPSEAVRSSEILPTLRGAGFEIFGLASAGGALLQPVLREQIHSYDPANWQHNLVLSQLFAEEDRLMREGVLQDDFVMLRTVPV